MKIRLPALFHAKSRVMEKVAPIRPKRGNDSADISLLSEIRLSDSLLEVMYEAHGDKTSISAILPSSDNPFLLQPSCSLVSG